MPEEDYLRALVEEGLRRRYGDPLPARPASRPNGLAVIDSMDPTPTS